MSQKIKSITITDETCTEQDIQFLSKVFKNVEANYEPEPEEKPVLLKRPDGSLLEIDDNLDDYIFIGDDYKIEDRLYDCLNSSIIRMVKQGRVFLKEDRHLAEKKAKMLTKQLEIQYEIDRLNAEQGWVADWQYTYYQKKHYLELYTRTGIKTVIIDADTRDGRTPMSEKTAETILAKYSQSDLKAYLGIIE